MSIVKAIALPQELTYVGVFLTLRCSFCCSYCINRFDGVRPREELTGDQWIAGLNRLAFSREKMVPITLQGGEPSSHKDFVNIIGGIDPDIYVDILTNLDFDVDEFMREIPPERLQRDVPYASIRVSYHPEFSDLDELLERIAHMQNKGYSIGLFAVEHPEIDIDQIRSRAEAVKIDFRTKEFLGEYDGRLYGRYKYAEACDGEHRERVQCRTTELIIAPDGFIHKCHRDLYHGEHPIGHILDKDVRVEFPFRECHAYGQCNPCDIKLKTNRFQQFGYCAVTIREDRRAKRVRAAQPLDQRSAASGG